MKHLDLDFIRNQFPALSGEWTFFDNAGGSQTAKQVGARIQDYLYNTNVQLGASYTPSQQAGERVLEAQVTMSKLINANELQWCDQCRLFYKLEESVLTEGGDVLCPVCGSHLKECLDFAEQLNNHLSDIIKKLRELWRYI